MTSETFEQSLKDLLHKGRVSFKTQEEAQSVFNEAGKRFEEVFNMYYSVGEGRWVVMMLYSKTEG